MQVLSLAIEECFDGEMTGHVNVTHMRNWLKEIKHPIVLSAFELWNADELLAAHEWDETFDRRTASLRELLTPEPFKAGTLEPFIAVKDGTGGVFIIDGWHRLWIMREWTLRNHKDIVPFPAYLVTLEDCKKFPVERVRHVSQS